MKRFLLAPLVFLLAAGPAAADDISLYGSADGVFCHFETAGFHEVYVIHKFVVGSVGVRFRLDTSEAPGTTVLTFLSPFQFTGQIETGLSIDYGACRSGAIDVGTIYLVAECGTLHTRGVVSVNCSNQDTYPGDRYMGVCTIEPIICPPWATEQTTWGRVKALYK